MVLAAPPIRKLHVGGRSRRHACFSLRKHPVSPSLHSGLSPVGYDFALANGDELVSYTVQKPRHAAVRYYTHSNHLYSVAATTNTAGAVVERYSYNAYGVRTVKNSVGATLAKSAVGQDRGFTGYRLDSETWLYFARMRMYSGKLGRFVSRDKLTYRNGPSLYSAYFVPNNLDPTGLLSINYGTRERRSGTTWDVTIDRFSNETIHEGRECTPCTNGRMTCYDKHRFKKYKYSDTRTYEYIDVYQINLTLVAYSDGVNGAPGWIIDATLAGTAGYAGAVMGLAGPTVSGAIMAPVLVGGGTAAAAFVTGVAPVIATGAGMAGTGFLIFQGVTYLSVGSTEEFLFRRSELVRSNAGPQTLIEDRPYQDNYGDYPCCSGSYA